LYGRLASSGRIDRSNVGLNHHRLGAGGLDSWLKARLGFAHLSVVYLEIVIVLGQLLCPGVFDDHLVCHVSRTRYKEAPRPKVSASAILVQMAVLPEQDSGALSLHALHQIARRNMRRTRHKQMHMVLANVTLEDLDLFLLYFVIHTRWNLMSKRMWAVRR
jgi:hypothetical protein